MPQKAAISEKLKIFESKSSLEMRRSSSEKEAEIARSLIEENKV